MLRGAFSKIIAEVVRPRALYLVDAWKSGLPDYGDYKHLDQAQWDAMHDSVVRRSRDWPCHVAVVRDLSAVAARKWPWPLLDFVYIDADHSARAVHEDIAAWARWMRPGGIIAGHDYNLRSVQRGVEAAFPVGTVINKTKESLSSWWVGR